MQGKMLLNTVQNVAKCETKSKNTRGNGKKKPLSNHETHVRKGRNIR